MRKLLTLLALAASLSLATASTVPRRACCASRSARR